jgi:transposase
MQQVATLGIDAAKNLFQLHGVDVHGKVVLKKRLARHKVLAFLAGLAPYASLAWKPREAPITGPVS